eukprot:CAMPEP_0119142404 /NCGR_PEP_ID=MMETSP1310-20130426/32566_1 /TAXON_ID=464262 /ORGANISM="Genus nov. species nov., Strain RCC2339" /LENGTH=342 /DNA_ID=CAMNT_0007133937 /DNA_START=221 /DNA_END=1249 /DNA_ORIENTATION=-
MRSLFGGSNVDRLQEQEVLPVDVAPAMDVAGAGKQQMGGWRKRNGGVKRQGKKKHIDQELGNVAVLVSLGRSGTSFMSRMLGEVLPGSLFQEFFVLAMEKNAEGRGANLKNLEDVENPAERMLEELRFMRSLRPSRNFFVGGKWKPWVQNDKFRDAVAMVAQRKWPVVLSTRNFLDRFISANRHYNHKDVPFNCIKGSANEKECLEKQRTKVYLNPNRVLQVLEQDTQKMRTMKQWLDEAGATYTITSYESWAFGPVQRRQREIQRVVDFICQDLPNKRHVNASLLENPFFTKGSSKSQPERVLNYVTIMDALQDTKYEILLHRGDSPRDDYQEKLLNYSKP